jgi:hypothetical protein
VTVSSGSPPPRPGPSRRQTQPKPFDRHQQAARERGSGGEVCGDNAAVTLTCGVPNGGAESSAGSRRWSSWTAASVGTGLPPNPTAPVLLRGSRASSRWAPTVRAQTSPPRPPSPWPGLRLLEGSDPRKPGQREGGGDLRSTVPTGPPWWTRSGRDFAGCGGGLADGRGAGEPDLRDPGASGDKLGDGLRFATDSQHELAGVRHDASRD